MTWASLALLDHVGERSARLHTEVEVPPPTFRGLLLRFFSLILKYLNPIQTGLF